jgi:quinol---cytochrome c reductase iron-sulfur subunit, bacillus type
MSEDLAGHESPGNQTGARRSFLKRAIGTLATGLGLVIAWPMVAMLIGPMYRRQAGQFAKVPGFKSAPIGQPVKLRFSQMTQDAFVSEDQTLEVWIVKHSDSEATVFSPICPHLGCPYVWQPRVGRFVCPCHGSFFTADGQVVAGPAPRPLDSLAYKIENGDLYVQWERFQPGIAHKVSV